MSRREVARPSDNSSLMRLTDDLVIILFGYFRHTELLILMKVNKKSRHIASKDQLWKPLAAQYLITANPRRVVQISEVSQLSDVRKLYKNSWLRQIEDSKKKQQVATASRESEYKNHRKEFEKDSQEIQMAAAMAQVGSPALFFGDEVMKCDFSISDLFCCCKSPPPDEKDSPKKDDMTLEMAVQEQIAVRR